MAVTVQVPWYNPHGHGEAWNLLLAWATEVYGLPGERWRFSTGLVNMYFDFVDEQDALMFQLKTAGQRVTHE
jgi:hypothetical protein